MKKIWVLTGGGVAAVSAWLLAHLVLAVFPQPLFAHRLDHTHFTVRSTQPIPVEMRAVLDRADALLAESELNEPDLHHDIYLCQSPRLMSYLFLRDMHFGSCLWTGDTFITLGDPLQDRAYCRSRGPEDRRRRTLSGSIVHEITHRLIKREVGFWNNRRLPDWVKEGYCDLIAQDSPLPLAEAVERLRDGERPLGLPMVVFRLMMDTLVREQGMAFREILQQPPDFAVTRAAALDPVRLDRIAEGR